MSDIDWSAYRRDRNEESKARRANHRERARMLLKQHGIAFTIHNQGAHIVIESADGEPGHCIDFWPGTGLYKTRDGKKEGRGIFKLFALMGVQIIAQENTHDRP